MPNYAVTACQLADNTATLTFDTVSGLYAGYPLTVEGVGLPYDGTHTISTVNVDTVTCSYAVTHANISQAYAAGVANVPVTWIEVADVVQFLGIQPSDDDDVTYLDDCTTAANDWAYERRQAFGYLDRPHLLPTLRVKLGTVLYAATLYRERGSVDSFSTFASLDPAQPVNGSLGQINRLLGLQRPVIA